MYGSLPQPIGLYVHIPFCVRKCTYCDFATWAGREKEIPRYVDAVIGEITRRGEETGHPKADTIFLGGGTPSLLNEDQITRVLEALFRSVLYRRRRRDHVRSKSGNAHAGFCAGGAEGGREPDIDGARNPSRRTSCKSSAESTTGSE